MATYNLYGLIVYGQPFGDQGKNRTGTPPCVAGQTYSRYLGYDVNNSPVTNSCFPNDADAGGSLTTRTWVPIGNGSTWLLLSPAQQNQLLYTPLTGNGVTPADNFTVNGVGGTAYAEVLAKPTLCASGSVKMNHRQGDGKLWYATFSVPGFGCEALVSTTITTDDVGTSEYTIPVGQDSVTIPVKVTAKVQYKGYFNSPDYVEKLFAAFTNNGANHVEQRKGESVVTSSITVYRSDFAGATSKTITLTGKGTLAAFGEMPSQTATKSVTVKLAVENGTPTASCSCSPQTVTFAGKDVTTSVTVNAQITGVSSSNIDKWIFYGHTKEGTQDQSFTVTPTGDKTHASATFSYTTSASKVTGDSYTAEFVQSATIVFKDGTRKNTGVTSCTTVIVKPGAPTPTPEPSESPEPPPPPPAPHEPVAIISGPTKVKAGVPLPFPIDGSKSFDWYGKQIVMYTWDHKVPQTTPDYYLDQFDEPGTYDVVLTVKNSAGLWSADAVHTIEVVPNEPPVATLAVPPEDTRLGAVRIQSNAYSPDGDSIVSHKFEMKYDANNNGFADDAWQTVQTGSADYYTLHPAKVGKYLFRETACENGNLCATSDGQPESERTLTINNLAPSIDVVTSSNNTDTSDRTPLTMDELYNQGTVVSLTNGATGDKSGWNLSNGVLSTKTFRTDLGMFNENWGAPDHYYGDDLVNHTLFASIQNPAELSLVGSYQYTKAYADDKYVYLFSLPSDSGFQPLLTLKIYNPNMVLQRTVTINSPEFGFHYTSLHVMTKGNYIYVTSVGNNGTFTYLVNRDTGQVLKSNILAGGAPPDFANPYPGYNALYADSKGVIGYGAVKDYYTRNGVEVYNGHFRANYDFSSPEAYYSTTWFVSGGLPQYISQRGNSVYEQFWKIEGINDFSRKIIYDVNQVQVGYLQSPAGTSYNFDLLGVDANHNFYSIGRQGSYEGDPKVFIHDQTGKIIRYFDFPSELRLLQTYEQYYGGTTHQVRFETQHFNDIFTVDREGNIWTTLGDDSSGNTFASWPSSASIVAITPTGEYKKVLTLNTADVTDSHNQNTFNILVGSDGLVTYFYSYNGTQNHNPVHNLQVVIIDPKTFSVVRNQTFQNVYVYSGTVSGTNASPVPGVSDLGGGKHQRMPFNVIPFGDQSYLIQGLGQDNFGSSNLYLLRASGSLSHPKAFDIGTPTQDVWIGKNVDGSLTLQGDMKVSGTVTGEGVGYVYLAQDNKNYYSAEFEAGQLRIKKTVGGATTTVFSKPYTLVAGQTYTLKFVPEAGGFSLYVNKVKQATVAENGWKSGKFGVISRGQQGVSFWNASTETAGAVLGKIYGVVLVGEPLTYDVTFDDPENDPRITAGETWTYTHNPNVFLNPQGVWSGSGQAQTAPITTFGLPGEYTFQFKTRDDPNPDYRYPSNVFDSYREYSNEVNGTIRVHRRPIADFTATADSTGKVTYTDRSYDPDRYNPATGQYSTEATGIDYKTNHGITTHRWRMLTPGATSYQYVDAPPTKVTQNGHYVIELQVQDEYGAWAEDWARQEFDVTNATPILPPIAGFTVTPALTYRGVAVTIDSVASDPQDGDRTHLAHAYYISNLTTGEPETLQSTSRTSWVKTFNSMGLLKIRQIVTNSYGLTDEATQTVTVANRKPTAVVTTPNRSDINSPTIFNTPQPTFAWTYADADGDGQTQYQVRIFRTDGSTYLDSGIQAGSAKTWKPAEDLPLGVVMMVKVRVFDGYDWGDWSDQKYFMINRPPTGDFTWNPQPVYEGDTVTFVSTVDDPDKDTLDVTYEIESPTGEKQTFRYTWDPPYPKDGPTLVLATPGEWTATLTVSDRLAPPVTVVHTLSVLPLTIAGQVKHTDAWEANRIRYNQKHPNDQRPADWFWAGEAFVLEAVATDTGESATKAVEVTADAGGGLRKALSAADAPVFSRWSGTLISQDAGFDLTELPEGEYTFVFRVRYSNGVIKTDPVTITIKGTVDEYVQVHRVQ